MPLNRSRRGVRAVEHRAFGGDFAALAVARRGHGDFQRVGDAALAGPRGLFDGQAALGGARRGVHQVDVLGEHGVEHSGQSSAAQDVRAQLRRLAGAGDAHTSHGEGRGLGGQ